jgi:aspartate aminotransferase-like enzyme
VSTDDPDITTSRSLFRLSIKIWMLPISPASMSHVSPAFAPVFGNCVRLLRKVLYTTDGQPFLVAGSGTLGWDAVGANLIEKGDKAVSA